MQKLKRRIRAAIVLAGVVALLVLAASLDPQALEAGTVTRWGLKPCGFLQRTGYPCPTCYMTRSFAYMMHARPLKAFYTQPFGAFLALLVMYLGYGAVRVLISGEPWRPRWAGWPKTYLLAALLAGFLGAWIFKLVVGTYVTGQFPLPH